VKILIAVGLIIVVFSLGQALFAMASGPENSGRVLRALTVRISVSVALFVALLIAWHFGLIEPHGYR
jgi:hypothetical protein